MNNNDSVLIQRTLEGDQQAFAELVEKYQSQIHALAWQEIGDFHIAQEITQDTFIKAYQKLATLKHPARFAGWLYVITNNNCKMWHRKKKLQVQSIEETDPVELEETYYSNYISHEREEEVNEKRRSLVHKLLSRLRESDRTVITLHYLAGLSCEEIGEFLGVATNTVKSRLYRARNRLRNEEALIQENLSSFQLPEQLSENIMESISNLSPATPAGNKPVIPWVISTTSAFLIVIILGVSAYQIYNFQKPYSLDSRSERTIEITEAKQVIDSVEKPGVHNQEVRTDRQIRNKNVSQNPNALLVDASQEDATRNSDKNNIIQKGKVSLTGNVVDPEGKPVAGVELTLKPVKTELNKAVVPLTPLASWEQVVTDNQGAFSFTNINPTSSQLIILPEVGSDYQLLSLKIGDLTVYSPTYQRFFPQQNYKLTFAIEPGVPLDDIVVTVKRPPRRIRGRILLKDGTPLANAGIDLDIKAGTRDTFLHFFKYASSLSITTSIAMTDSQGYFVYYLSPEINDEYAVSVMYEGASAKSGWFRLTEEGWYDDLVFKLGNLEKTRKKRIEHVNKRFKMWSVNPENGHAYKIIKCESWIEAKALAEKENAYLVAINDESEQNWIKARFTGHQFYWIGLLSTQEGNYKQWSNGEILTFTNWLSEEESTTESNTPVALDFFSKRWMSIGSKSQLLFAIKHAIIEKEDLRIR